MKKNVCLVLMMLAIPSAVFAEAASVAAGAMAEKGKMLVDSKGARLAPVSRVTSDGSAQIVFEGRMVTVPASTLAIVDGRLTTSLKKVEVVNLR